MEMSQILAVLGLAYLAFWRRDTVLYIICGFMISAFGLSWYDHYNSPTGLIVSIVIAAVGLYAIILAGLNVWDWWRSR